MPAILTKRHLQALCVVDGGGYSKSKELRRITRRFPARTWMRKRKVVSGSARRQHLSPNTDRNPSHSSPFMLLNSRVLLNRSGRSALSAGIIPHGARNGIPKAQSRSIQAKASSRSHQRRAMLEYQREMDLLRSQDGGEKLSKDDLLAKAQMNLMQQYGNPSADAYAMSAFPTFPSM